MIPPIASSVRYLLVSSHYAPLYQYGGPVRLAEQYVAAASEIGAKSTVLTIASAPELTAAGAATLADQAPHGKPGEPEIIRLAVNRHSVTGRAVAMFNGAWTTWQRLTQAERGVLHICEFRAPLTLGAVVALVTWGRLGAGRQPRIVHSVFGQLQPPNTLGKRGFDWLFRKLVAGTHYTVFAQNQHELAVARLFFGERETIDFNLLPLSTAGDPHCSPTACFAERAARRATAREALGLSSDQPVLIFLGRWVKEKGVERLLRAVSSLSEPLRPTVIIAGADFGYGDALRRLADDLGLHDRVRFIENVSDRRFVLYSAADVFTATPTIFEETMLASVEALSVGTPVLVSREADVPYLQEMQAGHVIDFSPASFERALIQILDNWAATSERASALAAQHFNGGALREHMVRALMNQPAMPE